MCITGSRRVSHHRPSSHTGMFPLNISFTFTTVTSNELFNRNKSKILRTSPENTNPRQQPGCQTPIVTRMATARPTRTPQNLSSTNSSSSVLTATETETEIAIVTAIEDATEGIAVITDQGDIDDPSLDPLNIRLSAALSFSSDLKLRLSVFSYHLYFLG